MATGATAACREDIGAIPSTPTLDSHADPEMTSRRTLSTRAGYALAALIVDLALFASGVPSPLYERHRELWGFSPWC